MRDVPLREASVTCNYPMEICRGSTVGHTAWNGVSCHDIAGIWVAFFSRCQRYSLFTRDCEKSAQVWQSCSGTSGAGVSVPD